MRLWIILDFNASTPIAPEVASRQWQEYWTRHLGKPFEATLGGEGPREMPWRRRGAQVLAFSAVLNG